MRNNFIGEIDPNDGITIKITIRTSNYNQNDNALLLWQGSALADNFIAIGLNKGQIEFKWFQGFTISTPTIVEPGTSMSITSHKSYPIHRTIYDITLNDYHFKDAIFTIFSRLRHNCK